MINSLARKDFTTVPRSELNHFAQLAKEAGVPNMGIKILYSVVHSEKPSEKPVTGIELQTYANCLLDLGAHHEAIRILTTTRTDWTAIRDFVLGMAYVRIWEATAAIPLLKAALHSKSLSTEQIATTLDALLFCYRFLGEFAQAEKLFELHVFQYNEFALTNSMSSLYGESAPCNPKQIQALKEQFAAAQNFRIMREIDFHLAHTSEDSKGIQALIFGTPYKGFRTRASIGLSGSQELPTQYILNGGDDATRKFDLYSGTEIGSSHIKLKLGQTLHRLFSTFLSDFYEPMSVAAIFEAVFPNETYHPQQAPARVHQIVKRLKAWLKKSNIPIVLDEKIGAYTLRFTGPYQIVISKEQLDLRNEPPLFLRLQVTLPGREFTIGQAAESLGLSRRFARKLLESAEKSGWINMKGKGRSTRYEFNRMVKATDSDADQAQT